MQAEKRHVGKSVGDRQWGGGTSLSLSSAGPGPGSAGVSMCSPGDQSGVGRSLARRLLGVRPRTLCSRPDRRAAELGTVLGGAPWPGPSWRGSSSRTLDGPTTLGGSCFLCGSLASSLCYFSVIFKPLFLSPGVAIKHRWLCLF